MGSPTFYYYPAGGALQTITLDASTWVTRLRDPIASRGSQRETFGGRVITAVRKRRWTVEIDIDQVREDLNVKICEEMRTMIDTAQRGHLIGFALDADEAWLSYLNTVPAPAATLLITSGSLGYNTSAAMAAGTRVRVETFDRQLYREDHTVGTTVSAGDLTVNLTRGIRQGLTSKGWVRQDGYHPALRLLLGESPEDNDRRILYSWRLRFLVDLDLLSSGEDLWGQIYTGTDADAAILRNPDALRDERDAFAGVFADAF